MARRTSRSPMSVARSLVISQFTLYADCRKGRRPSFIRAAPPALAEPLVARFADLLRTYGLTVAEGRFGTHMVVSIVNDGPFTIWLDTDEARAVVCMAVILFRYGVTDHESGVVCIAHCAHPLLHCDAHYDGVPAPGAACRMMGEMVRDESDSAPDNDNTPITDRRRPTGAKSTPVLHASDLARLATRAATIRSPYSPLWYAMNPPAPVRHGRRAI